MSTRAVFPAPDTISALVRTLRRPIADPAAYLRCAAVVLIGFISACVPQRAAVVSPAISDPAVGRAVYDSEVRVDPEAASLSARSTLRYIADENTAAKVSFLLNRGLTLEAVRGATVRSHRSELFEAARTWNLIEVDLDGVSPGAAVTLEFTYAGKPEFSSDNINGISSDWVELNLDSQWHPIFSTLDQQITGVLRVGLPSDWDVVASGSASFEDGFHVIRNTVPQVDVAFAAAPSLEETASEAATVYARKPEPRVAVAVLEAAESCGNYLNQRFGARDPLPQVKLVLAGRKGPGYARKNYIVLSQVSPDERLGLHRFLCHELAHYWTVSAGSFSPHHWMMEAFAEYVSGAYIRDQIGQSAFRTVVDQWETAGRDHGPVWTPESTKRPSGLVMYRRAPYLLHRLEERIGKEAFDRFIARYMSGGVRTTPALLDTLRDIAGPEAERWFREALGRSPSSAAS